MIQRIQTIFLILAGGAVGTLLAFPFASSEMVPGAEVHLFTDGVYTVHDHVALLILTSLGVLLAVVCILLYRNRKLQLRISYLLMTISLLIPVVAYLYFMNQAETLSEAPIRDGLGAWMPFVAFLCAIAANYYIRKDERIIRSMDRLR